MKHASIFSYPHYKWAASAGGILILAYILINFFVIGGDAFVISLNDSLTVPLAILTAIFAYSLFHQTRIHRRNHVLWGGLFIGFALWTIAETIWAVYGYLGQEVPYPSIADIFWLGGYIPLGFGLLARLREMPVRLGRYQKLALWVISLATIAVTFKFVILPVVQGFDASQLAGSLITIIYPLADLVLLISVFRLVFIYWGGNYGFGWNLMISGIALFTMSDLIYASLVSMGLYNPDGKINLISSFGYAIPYNLAYLVWIFGLYALRLTLKEQQPFEAQPQPKLVPNTHMLASTKSDGVVIGVTKNFGAVFDIEDPALQVDPALRDNTRMASFARLLQIPEEAGQAVLEKIRQNAKTATQHILVQNRQGDTQDVFVNGMAVFLSNGEFSGYNLLLRTMVENNDRLDDMLNTYQISQVSYLLHECGQPEDSEIRELLLDYYLTYLKQLYNLVLRTGGGHLGLVFQGHLLQAAQENHWPFPFDPALRYIPQTLPAGAEYAADQLRSALPALLEKAKLFAAKLTDPDAVEEEIQSISAQFSEAVHKNVAAQCTTRVK